MASVGMPPAMVWAGAGARVTPTFTEPAGMLRTAGHAHAEFGRNDMQLVAEILANDMTLGPTGTEMFRVNAHRTPLRTFG